MGRSVQAGGLDVQYRRSAVQLPAMKSVAGIVCKVGKGQQNVLLALVWVAGLAHRDPCEQWHRQVKEAMM